MLQAVIFDLDGTVLDNEPEWEAAFERVVVEEGLKISGAVRQVNGWLHEPGIGLESNWRRLAEGDVERVRGLARKTSAAYWEMMGRSLRLKVGAVELVEQVKDRGWRTALATTSFWHVVEEELEELALQLAFDVTVTGEEVQVLKPDAEIYLLTVQKLEVESEECLVVEDAVAGVRAAAEAGCIAVGLESDYAPKKTLVAAGAKHTVKDLVALGGELKDLE